MKHHYKDPVSVSDLGCWISQSLVTALHKQLQTSYSSTFCSSSSELTKDERMSMRIGVSVKPLFVVSIVTEALNSNSQ